MVFQIWSQDLWTLHWWLYLFFHFLSPCPETCCRAVACLCTAGTSYSPCGALQCCLKSDLTCPPSWRGGDGVERRARRCYQPVLPSIIMENVRSLPKKMDELVALTRHQREYSECSLLLFTETWLTVLTLDTAAQLEGFTFLRADRSKMSGKKKRGGLAVFVNNRWCNPGHTTVKEQHCSKDIELLCVSTRPHYLPREFTHALVVVVYSTVP